MLQLHNKYLLETNIPHKIKSTFVCIDVSLFTTWGRVIWPAEWSLFTPVTAAACDSVQSAHMFHESLWSQALYHSSIYSINSFSLLHLINICFPSHSNLFPLLHPWLSFPVPIEKVFFSCVIPYSYLWGNQVKHLLTGDVDGISQWDLTDE